MPPVAARQSASKDIDLGSWQKKLSGFASNPVLPQSHINSALKSGGEVNAEGVTIVADIATLKVEWHQFLDHIARKSKNFMSTHLQSCELFSCTPDGVLQIACCRKFSYEELQQDRALLQKEISDFYALPLQLQIIYDAEKDACTKEKTLFTHFQEFSQSNPVIRFLIAEFGGELVY